MINEQKILVFLSLASTLNFTETAGRLFVTQQAVSKHISQLEDDLGFPLFIRSTHSVKLTPAGERCQSFFKKQMEDFTEFIESERENQRRLSKSLRIGYNDWLDLGEPISSARIRFHDLYPDISHVPERQMPDTLQSKLRNGELDIILVLRSFLRQESGLVITKLAEMPMSIIVNRSYALSGNPLDTETLSSQTLLINSFAAETFQQTILRARNEIARFGLTNKKIVVTPNRDSLYTAVETGEGIATACAAAQLSGGIHMIPTNVTDALVCVRLESNKRKLVKRYMDILREEFHS